MWPMGSAPDVDGTPPLRRTKRHSARARSPTPARPRPAGCEGAPRLSIHMTQSPTGLPSSATGTVLAHWPVHDTATTLLGADGPARQGRAGPRR